MLLKNGYLIIFENFENANYELKSYIINLIQNKYILIKNEIIYFDINFRMVFLT